METGEGRLSVFDVNAEGRTVHQIEVGQVAAAHAGAWSNDRSHLAILGTSATAAPVLAVVRAQDGQHVPGSPRQLAAPAQGCAWSPHFTMALATWGDAGALIWQVGGLAACSPDAATALPETDALQYVPAALAPLSDAVQRLYEQGYTDLGEQLPGQEPMLRDPRTLMPDAGAEALAAYTFVAEFSASDATRVTPGTEAGLVDVQHLLQDSAVDARELPAELQAASPDAELQAQQATRQLLARNCDGRRGAVGSYDDALQANATKHAQVGVTAATWSADGQLLYCALRSGAIATVTTATGVLRGRNARALAPGEVACCMRLVGGSSPVLMLGTSRGRVAWLHVSNVEADFSAVADVTASVGISAEDGLPAAQPASVTALVPTTQYDVLLACTDAGSVIAVPAMPTAMQVEEEGLAGMSRRASAVGSPVLDSPGVDPVQQCRLLLDVHAGPVVGAAPMAAGTLARVDPPGVSGQSRMATIGVDGTLRIWRDALNQVHKTVFVDCLPEDYLDSIGLLTADQADASAWRSALQDPDLDAGSVMSEADEGLADPSQPLPEPASPAHRRGRSRVSSLFEKPAAELSSQVLRSKRGGAGRQSKPRCTLAQLTVVAAHPELPLLAVGSAAGVLRVVGVFPAAKEVQARDREGRAGQIADAVAHPGADSALSAAAPDQLWRNLGAVQHPRLAARSLESLHVVIAEWLHEGPITACSFCPGLPLLATVSSSDRSLAITKLISPLRNARRGSNPAAVPVGGVESATPVAAAAGSLLSWATLPEGIPGAIASVTWVPAATAGSVAFKSELGAEFVPSQLWRVLLTLDTGACVVLPVPDPERPLPEGVSSQDCAMTAMTVCEPAAALLAGAVDLSPWVLPGLCTARGDAAAMLLAQALRDGTLAVLNGADATLSVHSPPQLSLADAPVLPAAPVSTAEPAAVPGAVLDRVSLPGDPAVLVSLATTAQHLVAGSASGRVLAWAESSAGRHMDLNVKLSHAPPLCMAVHPATGMVLLSSMQGDLVWARFPELVGVGSAPEMSSHARAISVGWCKVVEQARLTVGSAVAAATASAMTGGKRTGRSVGRRSVVGRASSVGMAHAAARNAASLSTLRPLGMPSVLGDDWSTAPARTKADAAASASAGETLSSQAGAGASASSAVRRQAPALAALAGVDAGAARLFGSPTSAPLALASPAPARIMDECVAVADQLVDSARDDLRARIQGLQDKLHALVETNAAAAPAERLDRRDMVVDVRQAESAKAQAQAAAAARRAVLGYTSAVAQELSKAITADVWDCMEAHASELVGIEADLVVHNMPLRAVNPQQAHRLDVLTSLRRQELAALGAAGGMGAGEVARAGSSVHSQLLVPAWQDEVQAARADMDWCVGSGVMPWAADAQQAEHNRAALQQLGEQLRAALGHVAESGLQALAPPVAASLGSPGGMSKEAEQAALAAGRFWRGLHLAVHGKAVPESLHTISAEDLQASSHAAGDSASQDGQAEDEDEPDWRAASVVHLLYHPLAVRSPHQQRVQCALISALARAVSKAYNEAFDALHAEKQEETARIERANARMAEIAEELCIPTPDVFVRRTDAEAPEAVLRITDAEVEFERWVSPEEAAAREAERAAAAAAAASRDDAPDRALHDMMYGTLAAEDAIAALENDLNRPEWADEVPREAWSEEQRDEWAAYEARVEHLDTVKLARKRDLEAELHTLSNEARDAVAAWDERLRLLAVAETSTRRMVVTLEWYAACLGESVAARDDNVAVEATVLQLHGSLDAARSDAAEMVASFHSLADVAHQALAERKEEDRQAERQARDALRDASPVALDADLLRSVMNLYKWRPLSPGLVGLPPHPLVRHDAQAAAAWSEAIAACRLPVPAGRGGPPEHDPYTALRTGAGSTLSAAAAMSISPRSVIQAVEAVAHAPLPVSMIENDLPSELATPAFIGVLQGQRTAKVQAELAVAHAAADLELAQAVHSRLLNVYATLAARADIAGQLFAHALAQRDAQAPDTSVLVRLRQGQVETTGCALHPHQAPSVQSLGVARLCEASLRARPANGGMAHAALLPAAVVYLTNAQVRAAAAARMQALRIWLDARKELAWLTWENRYLQGAAVDRGEALTDMQLLRVTRPLRELLKGNDVVEAQRRDAAKADAVSKARQAAHERGIKKLERNITRVAGAVKKQREENDALQSHVEALETAVSVRRGIYASKMGSQSGVLRADGGVDLGATAKRAAAAADSRFKALAKRRSLMAAARRGNEQLQELRTEVARLRARSFPAFSGAAGPGGSAVVAQPHRYGKVAGAVDLR